jgi:hypothetical protein
VNLRPGKFMLAGKFCDTSPFWHRDAWVKTRLMMLKRRIEKCGSGVKVRINRAMP